MTTVFLVRLQTYLGTFVSLFSLSFLCSDPKWQYLHVPLLLTSTRYSKSQKNPQQLSQQLFKAKHLVNYSLCSKYLVNLSKSLEFPRTWNTFASQPELLICNQGFCPALTSVFSSGCHVLVNFGSNLGPLQMTIPVNMVHLFCSPLFAKCLLIKRNLPEQQLSYTSHTHSATQMSSSPLEVPRTDYRHANLPVSSTGFCSSSVGQQLA